MPIVEVDTGAIKFIINGANLMCQGISSVSGDVEEDTPVLILAQGKKLPLAVGITRMSGNDIQTINKGIGVEILHVLGDGLWCLKSIE